MLGGNAQRQQQGLQRLLRLLQVLRSYPCRSMNSTPPGNHPCCRAACPASTARVVLPTPASPATADTITGSADAAGSSSPARTASSPSRPVKPDYRAGQLRQGQPRGSHHRPATGAGGRPDYLSLDVGAECMYCAGCRDRRPEPLARPATSTRVGGSPAPALPVISARPPSGQVRGPKVLVCVLWSPTWTP